MRESKGRPPAEWRRNKSCIPTSHHFRDAIQQAEPWSTTAAASNTTRYRRREGPRVAILDGNKKVALYFNGVEFTFPLAARRAISMALESGEVFDVSELPLDGAEEKESFLRKLIRVGALVAV